MFRNNEVLFLSQSMDDKSFNKFAESYDQLLAKTVHGDKTDTLYFAEYKVALMAKKLERRRVAKVLDFGCGPGRSLPLLRSYLPQAQVFGFDTSEACVGAAKRRCPEATLLDSIDELKLHQFDAILLANVLHHVAPGARADTFRRCAGSLAPCGSLFIVEHNPLNPVTRWIFERCPFDEHAVMLPRREVMDLAQEATLRLAASGYTLFFPQWLRILRRFESALEWLPLGAQYYVQYEK